MNTSHAKKAGTPFEMARLYGIPAGTLANWRYLKRGPKFFKVGKTVLYFTEDFENWLRRNPVLTKDSLPERNHTAPELIDG